MLFQSGKYCDILIHQKVVLGFVEATEYHLVRIRDTGDTHLDIACTDLPHALELWTAIERSPEVKIVVNVNDYIHIENTLDTVKEETFPCPHCIDGYAWPNEEQRDFHITYTHRDEFADCKHRPIAKEDCNPGEFDLEEMA